MCESRTIERAYRLRVYPTRRQQRVLGRLFGASRYVWNWALARRSQAYQTDKLKLNWVSLSRGFTALKAARETAWLGELRRQIIYKAPGRVVKSWRSIPSTPAARPARTAPR